MKRFLWIPATGGLALAAALYFGVGASAADSTEPTDTTTSSDTATSADDTETTPSTKETTSEVKIETLVSSQSYNGDLGFGKTRELVSQSNGTITWLPEEETVIESGDVLWKVDQQPVLYLHGEIPMYRELYSGVKKGDDVAQLEQFLIDNDYGPESWEANQSFDKTTRLAVKDFQKFHGMTKDGSLGPAEVVFGDKPLRVASTGHLGDAAGAGPILSVTDSTAKVTMASTSRQLPTFQKAKDVTIELSDGAELAATLDETKATPADETGAFGYSVSYVVSDPVNKAQPVKVKIDQVLASDALTVPIDALIALTEGGYAVEVKTDDGLILRAVEVVNFDDTRVAITGNLSAGDLVVVP